MKRKLVEENELPSKKIVKNNHDDDDHYCLLDLNYSSNLLSTKIADIPHKLKYETIIAPIFEYCFGTSDQDIVWEKHRKNDSVEEEESFPIIIDWIRDETFIFSQIFNLHKTKFIILASKLGLFNNRKFILNAVQYFHCSVIFPYCNSFVNSDFEIMMAAVKEDGTNIKYASTELRNNREIVKQAVINDGLALRYASEELQDDKEIVMLASSSDAYVDASMRLQKDREVVFKAVSNGCNFSLVDSSFNNDRELILMSTKFHGIETLQFACSELRNDKEIVLQAIQQNPLAFKYVSDELKNDREFVKEIVKKYGECLRYVPEKIREDKEIVDLALKSYPDALYCISSRLRKDTEFISKIIGKRGFVFLPKEFSNDRQIVLESIKIYPRNLQSASMKLQNDREFILQVVKNCAMAFEYIQTEFIRTLDREIIMEAITQNGAALEFMPYEYLNDEEIVIKAGQTAKRLYHKYPFHMVSDRLKNDRQLLKKYSPVFFTSFPRKYQLDREIVMEFIEKTNPKAEKTYPGPVFVKSFPLIVSDRVLAMKIVKRDGLLLRELPFKYRNDREIVSFAIQQNKEAFKFISDELKNDLEILKNMEIVQQLLI